MSKWNSENVPVIRYQKTAASPEHHPIPRDRATAPSPTHTAALAIPDESTGVAAKLGERRFFEVALPETASNHYVSFWLSGRALDSGQARVSVQIPLSLLFRFFLFSAVVLLYCCTHSVGSWFVLGGWVFMLCTVLYCCTTYCFPAIPAPRWNSCAYQANF